MSRKKIIIFGSLAVVVVGLIGLNAAGQRDRGVSVRLEEVGRRDLVASVTASGQIEPKRSVDISADITGRITHLPVEEGDWVRRGDLVLRIDPSQYEAAVARARAMMASAEASALQAVANRDQAKRAADRAEQLRRQDVNLVSDEQLEQARTQHEVAEALAVSARHQVAQAQASLQEVQEQLAKTVLRAPMAGQVTRLAVEEGEVAVPGTFSRETGLLMTIADLSVEVTIDAFPDTAFTGRVTRISQSAVRGLAQTSGGTNQAVDYDVEVTLDDPPEGIRPDLSATAKVITATRGSSLSIPIIALTVREHEPISTETAPQDTTAGTEEMEGVFVVSDGAAEFRPVKVGIAGEEYFEVLEGLEEGDTLVAGPYQTIRELRDGARVRPTEERRPEEDQS
jgi:HlyD family secretion protein